MAFTVVLHNIDARKGIRTNKVVAWFEVVALPPVVYNESRGLLVLKLFKGGHYSFLVGKHPGVLYHRLDVVYNQYGKWGSGREHLGERVVTRTF